MYWRAKMPRKEKKEEKNSIGCCGGNCCGEGHIETDLEYAERVPSIDGEIIVGYALDEGEDYEFLDPEPITGYTLLEEIKLALYSAKSELNRLEKLLNTYEDVSRIQR